MTGRAKTWRSRRWWPARLRTRIALFARVLETKTKVVGDPAASSVSGAKLLPFLYPVLTDGRVVTFVTTSIDLIWLSQALGAVASGLGASAGSLNGSGIVVTRWPGADTWTCKTTSSRSRPDAAAIRSRLSPAFVAQTADRVEQILSVRPFPIFGDTVFCVAVSVVLALAADVGWLGTDLAKAVLAVRSNGQG